MVYSLSVGAELSIWWGVVLSDSESHRSIAFIAIIIFVSTIKNVLRIFIVDVQSLLWT